ncbi:hypothetical protein PBY51_021012 [Eleginops maclovinus]|uniref:Uncharacterized protein n=1 Tax=Eleginops maclovinus TaxID=56733 RepID=A0AAN7XDK6_ELEMC|nr:hypothetical protein PBY51_021012 [Eleginops maclovinus]
MTSALCLKEAALPSPPSSTQAHLNSVGNPPSALCCFGHCVSHQIMSPPLWFFPLPSEEPLCEAWCLSSANCPLSRTDRVVRGRCRGAFHQATQTMLL